jgi:hypothetical protein
MKIFSHANVIEKFYSQNNDVNFLVEKMIL